MCTLSSDSTVLQKGHWRKDAVAIIEELFPVTSRKEWDRLLDLRALLLNEGCCKDILEKFLECRIQLESDHYLPFYRLRRLIAGSLRLEAVMQTGGCCKWRRLCPLNELWRHDSLSNFQKAVKREWFEHDVTTSVNDPVTFKVVESEAMHRPFVSSS